MAATVAQRYYHGHDSVLEYTIDWTNWLDSNESLAADSIVASSWACDNVDATLGVDVFVEKVVNGKSRWYTTVWVTALPLGQVAKLTNRIETALGREEERTIELVSIDR